MTPSAGEDGAVRIQDRLPTEIEYLIQKYEQLDVKEEVNAR